MRWRTSRKNTVKVASSNVAPVVKIATTSIATGRKSSAGLIGWRSTAISSSKGRRERAKFTRFEPTTERGKTAWGMRIFRISS